MSCFSCRRSATYRARKRGMQWGETEQGTNREWPSIHKRYLRTDEKSGKWKIRQPTKLHHREFKIRNKIDENSKFGRNDEFRLENCTRSDELWCEGQCRGTDDLILMKLTKNERTRSRLMDKKVQGHEAVRLIFERHGEATNEGREQA